MNTSDRIGSMQKLTFTPWIGPQYLKEELGGTQLLVVGESHYGDEEEAQGGFTRNVVQSKVYNSRNAFFTKIAKLIVGRGAGNYIPQSEREWVWDRIAFYNYIQSMAGAGPDGDVTDQMWQEARRPFLDVVEVTRPDAVLILGKELGRHVPTFEEDSSLEGIESFKGVRRLTINHVSRGFSYDPWMEKVQELVGVTPPQKKD